MTYRFMRIVDDSLGTVLCRVLGYLLLLKNLLLPARRTVDNSMVKRILIQKYFGMGSILHAIPLIKVLRKNYPKARIIFITNRNYQELLTVCGLADDVLTVDFGSIPGFLKSCFRIAAFLLTTRFDISVDLEFFAKFPMLVSALSGSPIRLGLYQRKIRPEGIITHKVYYNFYRHISEIYLSYASQLNLEADPACLTGVLPSFRHELEKSLRERFNLDPAEKIIVVNINAGKLFAFRKWPGHNYSQLLSMLCKRYGDYAYLLIGTAAEYDDVEEVLRNAGPCRKILNCAGKTTLRELLALVEMAYLVISNDSGPLHIASYFQKNIAAFFGPETPTVYGPLNAASVVFYPDKLYCSPCMCVFDNKQSLYAKTCVRNDCLLSQKPEQVFERIESRFLRLHSHDR